MGKGQAAKDDWARLQVGFKAVEKRLGAVGTDICTKSETAADSPDQPTYQTHISPFDP
jgi:hypothetical protein